MHLTFRPAKAGDIDACLQMLPAHRPFLIGGSRAETKDGSYLSPLFLYTPPRFFFKTGEQELLRLALRAGLFPRRQQRRRGHTRRGQTPASAVLSARPPRRAAPGSRPAPGISARQTNDRHSIHTQR